MEYKQYKYSRKLYNNVSESAVQIAKVIPEENSIYNYETTSTEVNLKNKPMIDFEYLKDINSDIVGWISREDKKINYPIVQGKDNDFYLYRSVDKTQNKAGSIFIDYKNSKDFSDDITLVYGHNMKDNSMFGLLKDYKDNKNIQDLPDIKIHTPTSSKVINIKYVFLHSGYEELRINFHSDREWEEYIKEIESKAIYKAENRPVPKDKMISLITCDNSFENARLIILGVLE